MAQMETKKCRAPNQKRSRRTSFTSRGCRERTRRRVLAARVTQSIGSAARCPTPDKTSLMRTWKNDDVLSGQCSKRPAPRVQLREVRASLVEGHLAPSHILCGFRFICVGSPLIHRKMAVSTQAAMMMHRTRPSPNIKVASRNAVRLYRYASRLTPSASPIRCQ